MISSNILRDTYILIFADDTSLFATGSDPAESAIKLNRDLGKYPPGLNSGKFSLILKNQKILFSQGNMSIILCFLI